MTTTRLQFRAYRGSGTREVMLSYGGYDTDFVNLSITGVGMTTHSDDIKALRNELIKIYPLDTPATVAEPSEYTTRHMCGRWEIVREVPSTDIAVVGYADDLDGADRIAKALNESEGL